jgi:hypothetical protein
VRASGGRTHVNGSEEGKKWANADVTEGVRRCDVTHVLAALRDAFGASCAFPVRIPNEAGFQTDPPTQTGTKIAAQ